MKRMVFFAAMFSFAACSNVVMPESPIVTAHRGGHIDGLIPENSMAGIASAARFGYGMVECDPKMTSDSVIVLMHDKTINRTMRLKEGYLPIERPLKVSSLTFRELRENYVFASDDPAQRVQIPTLEEFALECRRQGMKIMLHSSLPEADRLVHSIMGEDWVCFTSDRGLCRQMRSEGFGGLVMFSTEDRDLDAVTAILRGIGEPAGLSTMDKKKPADRQLTPEYIGTLRNSGFSVQSSIFKTPYEVESVHDGCDYVLSDFYWVPVSGQKPAERWKGPRRLVEGESIEKSFAPLDEYGAISVKLVFKGRLHVEVCGHVYDFDHEDFDFETIGIRLYGRTPALILQAAGPVRFRLASAEVYSL